jgi:hypothetical protein
MIREDIQFRSERLRFRELSAGDGGSCPCRLWQQIRAELLVLTSTPGRDLRLLSRVDDGRQEYEDYECDRCGVRWRCDHNPDSNPSFMRWWPSTSLIE